MSRGNSPFTKNGVRTKEEAKLLDYERVVRANKLRDIADAKEKELRKGVAFFVEKGFRVEELALIEQRHPSRDPNLDRILVKIEKPKHPLVLALRLFWRKHVRTYAYKVEANRDESKVMRPGVNS